MTAMVGFLGLLALALVASVAVHEAGHAAAALALGLPCKPILTRHGPGVQIGSDSIRLRRWQVVVTAAAGPAANVALAAVAYQLGQPLLVLVSAELAVANLVPFPRSDGSRMLRPGRAIRAAIR